MSDSKGEPTTTSDRRDGLSVGAVRRPTVPSQGATKGGMATAAMGQTRSLRKPVSASARKLQSRSWAIVSVLMASGALIAPFLWLCVVLALVLSIAGLEPIRNTGARGTADVLVTPLTFLRGAASPLLDKLNPFRFLRLVLVIVVGVLLSVLLAGGWAWFTSDRDSAYELLPWIHVRMGIWAHAPELFAALMCFAMLRSVKPMTKQRASFSKRVEALSETQLTSAAIGIAVAVALVVLVLPRATWAPFGSGSGFATGLPFPGLESAALNLADAEVDATVQCFIDEETTYDDQDNDNGLYDQVSGEALLTSSGDIVANVVIDSGADVSTEARNALLVALQNQLPSWISEITVDYVREVSLDRRDLQHAEPVLSLDGLADHIRPSLASTSVAGHIDTAVTCSLSAG